MDYCIQIKYIDKPTTEQMLIAFSFNASNDTLL